MSSGLTLDPAAGVRYERSSAQVEFEKRLDNVDCDQEVVNVGQKNDSSESDSICTTVPRQQHRQDSTSEEQILSAAKLESAETPPADREIFQEVYLGDKRPQAGDSEMFAVYRQQQADDNLQPNDSSAGPRREQQAGRCNGFSEAPPKITFASRRMKQYFESFKSHKSETVRLYQFFKSTRTELVACLLFTLISSQALIVLRTHLIDDSAPTAWPLNPTTLHEDTVQDKAELAAAGSSTREAAVHQQQQQQQQQQHHHLPAHHSPTLISNSNGPLGTQVRRSASVQVAHGLVVAFTVASLTQIFGHISGCHLIPSVSLALYVKGHISRARFASYLAAQLLGSALGVSLLSLLSSSQLTASDYRELLVRAPILVGDQHRIRARRDVSSSQFEPQKLDPAQEAAAAAAQPGNLDSNEYPGSETILLSIIEQLERQAASQQLARSEQEATQHRKRSTSAATGEQLELAEPHEAKRLAPAEVEKTITVGVNTYLAATAAADDDRDQQRARHLPRALGEQRPTSANTTTAPLTPSTSTSTTTTPTTVTTAHETAPQPTTIAPAGLRRWNYSSDGGGGGEAASEQETAPSRLNDRSRVVVAGGRRLDEQPIDVERRPTSNATALVVSDSGEWPLLWSASQPDAVTSSRRPKLRRRSKRNKQQQQQRNASQQSNEPAPDHHYINLLEFTLPDQIMSSESIRQCIDKQLGADASQQLAAAAADSFHNCLSLSNSSQMFVFQFVATLLVVLAYLVNVDPRRIDPGFKSLSIGLSYFVASVVTIHSGGFYANPFHLVFLSWLSPTSEWRSEWFIYLVCPLIGGLFGAISHEYIDFSSARNRNKQLHLRRSFYSLDNLPTSGPGAEEPHACLEMCGLRQAANVGRQLSSSSSLESAGATSSVLSFASQHVGESSSTSPPQPQPRSAPNSAAESLTANRNKLARYPRPARTLDQRACNDQAQAMKQELAGGTTSLRRSDFDANFLISSNGGDGPGNPANSSLSSASSASSPPPPPPTAIRRQLPAPANGWL